MRYITAIQAKARVIIGLPVQSGNWVAKFGEENSRKICDGYVMHNTNPKKSVGKRSSKVWSEGKIGRIVDREPMSTKYAKKHMTYAIIMSQKNRLRKQIIKAEACIAILEDNK